MNTDHEVERIETKSPWRFSHIGPEWVFVALVAGLVAWASWPIMGLGPGRVGDVQDAFASIADCPRGKPSVTHCHVLSSGGLGYDCLYYKNGQRFREHHDWNR